MADHIAYVVLAKKTVDFHLTVTVRSKKAAANIQTTN